MHVKRGRGQTWSLDLILAVGVFILFIVAFYAIISAPEKPAKDQDLKQVAEQISERLDSESGNDQTAVVFQGEINQSKLNNLSEQDYQDLKRMFGVSTEFCIYLEDENGRLVPINGKLGVGGDTIGLEGTACNSTIT